MRKSGKKTPAVISGVLYTNDENTTGIRLSEAAWGMWLEDASSFYFEAGPGSFSARKERQRRGFFWYAYKRVGGRLLKRYLGQRQAVTLARLNLLAAAFAVEQAH